MQDGKMKVRFDGSLMWQVDSAGSALGIRILWHPRLPGPEGKSFGLLFS